MGGAMTRKPYLREIPKFWWLSQRHYTSYMARELSCLFIGAYALVVSAIIDVSITQFQHTRPEDTARAVRFPDQVSAVEPSCHCNRDLGKSMRRDIRTAKFSNFFFRTFIANSDT